MVYSGNFEEWFVLTVASGNSERAKALQECLRAFGATPSSTEKCLFPHSYVPLDCVRAHRSIQSRLRVFQFRCRAPLQ